VARDRHDAGALLPVSAYCMKHPPVQMYDHEARKLIEEYIKQTPAKEGKQPISIKKRLSNPSL
jgi:myo-inositol-1-phosphate synthase